MLDLYELIPDVWRAQLSSERENLTEIAEAIALQERQGKEVIPVRNEIFRALRLSPEEVRVVILGQDPYPNRSHAMGRAFAVPTSITPLPGSLRNILRERREDVGGPDPASDLSSWQSQGVLLLNRTLTTNHGEVNAHASFGWQRVTETILEVVASQGAIGVLWGKSAASSKDLFGSRVLLSAHPSPLAAHRGFFGSRPFSKVNEKLHEPIAW